MSILKEKYRIYFFGGVSGLILTLTVATCGQYFGSSTTFSRLYAGLLSIIGINLDNISFFANTSGNFHYSKLFGFQGMFLFGIFLGARLSALTNNEYQSQSIPKMFKDNISSSVTLRYTLAFIGGAIMIIGARLAGGCASWWGISVSSRLEISSFATLTFFFIGGATVNFVLYRFFNKN